MSAHNFTEGQPVEYYRQSLGEYSATWKHGHVRAVEDHPTMPLVFIDTTWYDYNPSSEAMDPEKVRPATAECTSVGSCHSLSAYEYRQGRQ